MKGKADPAWWLNLQVDPDATVALADDTRRVRTEGGDGDTTNV